MNVQINLADLAMSMFSKLLTGGLERSCISRSTSTS
jgi:hypothetical protein